MILTIKIHYLRGILGWDPGSLFFYLQLQNCQSYCKHMHKNMISSGHCKKYQPFIIATLSTKPSSCFNHSLSMCAQTLVYFLVCWLRTTKSKTSLHFLISSHVTVIMNLYLFSRNRQTWHGTLFNRNSVPQKPTWTTLKDAN